MSYLVPDFLINPLLRQARRFSRTNSPGERIQPTLTSAENERTHEIVVENTPDESRTRAQMDIDTDFALEHLSDAPLTSSPIQETGGLEAELGGLETGRRPSAAATFGTSHVHALPRRFASLRSDPGQIDDDVSVNPSFVILDGLQSDSPMSTSFSSVTGINANMSPAEGPSRQSTEEFTSENRQRNHSLPADDGMGALRQRIIMIQGLEISADEKAHMMHRLLTQRYKHGLETFHAKQPPQIASPGSMVSQEKPTTPGSLSSFIWQMNGSPEASPLKSHHIYRLCPDDLKCTYAPIDPPEPDESAEDAQNRLKKTPVLGCPHYKRNVKLQCSTCDRWKGRGLGKDFFHCKTCGVCMSMSVERSHKCIERVSDCDCPICGEYMFTSPRPVVFMLCGHSIHQSCYYEHIETSYKCPICSKSTVNMESQFRNLDRAIDAQPMPPQFQDTKAMVSCNDCYAKSAVEYHWLGLKCAICDSYNTVQLSILSDPAVEVPDGREPEGPSIPVPSAGENLPVAQMGVVTTRSRRHSSHIHSTIAPLEIPNRFFPYPLAQRLGRSVSPIRGLGLLDDSESIQGVETDETGDEDDLDFWGRDELRSMTSGENFGNDIDGDDGDDYDDDSASEMDDCEEEGEEADQFELIGHR
ncbi:hypothetical protein B7494_g3613 [Chlorociboria aeruginascens]|nr:hypothetical protein B7494_g3613 [Chlorociboria aeruginascens]